MSYTTEMDNSDSRLERGKVPAVEHSKTERTSMEKKRTSKAAKVKKTPSASKAKTKKKAPKKRKREAPKRPLNGFILYCNSMRSTVAAGNPGASVTEMSSLLGQLWRSMTEEEKSVYTTSSSSSDIDIGDIGNEDGTVEDVDDSLVAICQRIDEACAKTILVEGVKRLESTSLDDQLDSKSRKFVPDCVVCLDSSADHVVVPCMHMCLCERCSSRVSSECPTCRAPITNIQKVFY